MLRWCGVYLSFFTAIIELIRGVNAQNNIRAEQRIRFPPADRMRDKVLRKLSNVCP